MHDTTTPPETYKSICHPLNCKNCKALLETAAHFCPKCGTLMVTSPQGAISMSSPTSVPSGNATKSSKGVSRSLSALRKTPMLISTLPAGKASGPLNLITPTALTAAKANKPILETETQTIPFETQLRPPIPQFPRKILQPWGLPPSDVFEAISLSQPNLSPIKSPQPLLYYQFNTTNRRLQMLPAVVNTFPHSQKKRHGLISCSVWALVILALLLIGLTISWFSVIRPSIHTIAERKLNAALDRAEGNIPPPLLFLPGMVVPIHEQTLTGILVRNLELPSPIKNPVTHITSSNVRTDFQLYGFPCSITLVPQVTNGHLVVSNVNIGGIISLVMSPDEITTLLDKHLTHAQELFQHSVTNVQLKDQEMDLTFM